MENYSLMGKLALYENRKVKIVSETLSRSYLCCGISWPQSQIDIVYVDTGNFTTVPLAEIQLLDKD